MTRDDVVVGFVRVGTTKKQYQLAANALETRFENQSDLRQSAVLAGRHPPRLLLEQLGYSLGRAIRCLLVSS